MIIFLIIITNIFIGIPMGTLIAIYYLDADNSNILDAKEPQDEWKVLEW